MDQTGQLVTLAASGDLDAFADLVRRFQDMAYGYACSILGDWHLAEDATAEAFFQAYRDLASLRKPAAFPGWLRRIVFKHCDRIRRARRVRTVPLDAAPEAVSAAPGPAETAQTQEIREHVFDAVWALPEPLRIATTLFYINGYSASEIAEFVEAPPGTIRRRLHDARKRLKERMMTMVADTLKDSALPEDFADRLLMFPFPRIEPEVEVVDLPGRDLSVRGVDSRSHFTPLVEAGACDWCFYDRPGGVLTGVNESRVVGLSQRGQRTLLRVWNRYTDLKREGKQEWEETHLLVEQDSFRWVALDRPEPGRLLVGDYKFPGDPEGCPSLPEPMDLSIGTKWATGDGRGEVVGVSRVRVAERDWTCVKIAFAAQFGKTGGEAPGALAEWYVAECGRAVFFRRYNGPGYCAADKPRSFESLAGELEIQFEGTPFRHSYDCLPDIALENVFACS